MSDSVKDVLQRLRGKKTRPAMEPVGPAEIAEAKAYLQQQVSFDIDEFLDSQTVETLFSSPLGPTPDCLSIDEIAAVATSSDASLARMRAHAQHCESCRGDVRLYQELRENQWPDTETRDLQREDRLSKPSLNAITLLKADHVTIKRLLRDLHEVSERATKQRETLVKQLERELRIHAQIEEEIFYPAFKAASRSREAEDLFYEAAEEHHIVDMVLPALMAANPKSKEFKAKASVLKELVEHHIKEEETQMFAEARSLFSDEQLRELGDMMQARKDSVEAMWDNPLLRPGKKFQSAVHRMLPAKVKGAKVAKTPVRPSIDDRSSS
jgi:hypothetical protein